MLQITDVFVVKRTQVERKINLVYGGGSIGLMGMIAETVYKGGCHVLGYVITPQTCFYLLYFSKEFYNISDAFSMYRVIPKALVADEVRFNYQNHRIILFGTEGRR